MLFLNNTLTGAIVICCWYMAHLFSSRSPVLGRIIALIFGLVGVMITAVAAMRTLQMDIQIVSIVSKGSYLILFVVLGIWVNGSKRLTTEKSVGL